MFSLVPVSSRSSSEHPPVPVRGSPQLLQCVVGCAGSHSLAAPALRWARHSSGSSLRCFRCSQYFDVSVCIFFSVRCVMRAVNGAA